METLYNKANNTLRMTQGVFQIDSKKLKSDLGLIDTDLKYENGSIILSIRSKLLEENNYKISKQGQKLILILSEKREINRPIHVHHLNRDIFQKTFYERLRSFEITLPREDLHIIKTSIESENYLLKVYLSIMSRKNFFLSSDETYNKSNRRALS